MNHTNGRVNYGCIYENGFEPEEVGPDLTFDAFNDDIPLENTGLETDSWFVKDAITTTRNEQKR